MLTLASFSAEGLGIIFGAAALVGLGLKRLKISPIPGYLITGALIGPGGFGLIGDSEAITTLSELALILLMFTIGLHLDLRSLASGAVRPAIAGLFSTILIAVAAVPIAAAFGVSARAALAIGLAFSMSSTAVVMKILQTRRELETHAGRWVFMILLMQDILVVVALAFLPLLAQTEAGTALSLPALAGQVASVLAVGAGIFLFSRFVLPKLLTLSSDSVNHEATIILAAGIAMGGAWATQSVGLSAELGAFVAGLLFSATIFKHQVESQVAPLRDILMAVFLIVTGFQIDTRVIAELVPQVALVAGAVIAGKFLILMFCVWGGGNHGQSAARVALCLAQAGEFSLVVLKQAGGEHLKILSDTESGVCVTAVVISLTATPAMIALSPRLSRAFVRLPQAPWAKRFEPEEEAGSTRGHVVIAGFGLVGRAVADELEKASIPYRIVELNTKTIETQRALGRHPIYGDASRHDVLHAAQIESASALVLTIPDPDAVLRACSAARGINPGLRIAARTNVMSKGMVARQLGADHVVIEELAAAHQMVEFIRKHLDDRKAEARDEPNGSPG